MPSIIKEWKLDAIMVGMLTSAGIWGMFLGAIVWGPVTDKYGRKVGFIGTILGFSMFSGLTIFATGVGQFLIYRFITGMCLGGMIPVDTALVSEYISAKHRGRFVAVLTVLWPFGLLAAAISSLMLVPTHGWRILFILGVLPAALSFIVRWKVPESPRWLAIKGRKEEAATVLKQLGATDADVRNLGDEQLAEKVPIGVLLKKPYLRRFILTAGYYFFRVFWILRFCTVASINSRGGIQADAGENIYLYVVRRALRHPRQDDRFLHHREVRQKAIVLCRIRSWRRGCAWVWTDTEPRIPGLGSVCSGVLL